MSLFDTHTPAYIQEHLMKVRILISEYELVIEKLNEMKRIFTPEAIARDEERNGCSIDDDIAECYREIDEFKQRILYFEDILLTERSSRIQ